MRSALGTKKEEVKRLQKQLTTLDTATFPSSLTDDVLKAKVSDRAIYMYMYAPMDHMCTCAYKLYVCMYIYS